MLAIVVSARREIEPGSTTARRLLWWVPLGGYVAVHLAFACVPIFENIRDFGKAGPVARNAAVARLLPQPHAEKSILAYDDFIFDEIKNFRRIQSLVLYTFYREKRGLPPISATALLDSAQAAGIDFILLKAGQREQFGITDSLLRAYSHKPQPPNLYFHSGEYTIFRMK